MKDKDIVVRLSAMFIVVGLSIALWNGAISIGRAAPPPPTNSKDPEALPAVAQEAFENGLAAVQQQNWDAAIRAFAAAQEAAPVSPAVLLNLGLAHAKAGHELAAVAWLRAFLATTCPAEKRTAVRNEIRRLEVAATAKRDKIFDGELASMPQGNRNLLFQNLWFQAFAGRLDVIQRHQASLITLWKNEESVGVLGQRPPLRWKEEQRAFIESICPRLFWKKYAEGLARAGDIDGAQAALAEVKDELLTAMVQCTIAEAHAFAGRPENARHCLGQAEQHDPTWPYDGWHVVISLYNWPDRWNTLPIMIKSARAKIEAVESARHPSSSAEEWMLLARTISQQPHVVALTERLQWARATENVSPCLISIANSFTETLQQIHALERKLQATEQ